MAIFYGLYVADKRLAAALDLIRFLAEPNFFRRAHITVRGPYAERLDPTSEKVWENKTYQIMLASIDHFFVNSQSTVFLKCQIPEIDAIWHKPDYAGQITPHITFYDGKDRGFGYALLNILKKNAWNFSAPSTPLTIIKSKAKSETLDEFAVHQNLYDEILGRRIDYKAVRLEPARQRLVLISWVVSFLQNNFSDQNTH